MRVVKLSTLFISPLTRTDFTRFVFVSFLSLQKFTGHSTAVTTLCFATTRSPDSNGLYFLSGAEHDRLLSVW